MYKQISENKFNELLNFYEQGGTYQKKKTMGNRMESKLFEDVGFDDPTRKAEVKEDLQSNIMEVTFTKKDGEQRVVTCTLVTEAIPVDKRPKPLAEGEEPKPAKEHLQSVWDVKAEGWRSFIWANVTAVKVAEDLETV